MTNMLLEDLMNLLGDVGTTTLRRGKNDRSATPGHQPVKWSCEISLAGYNNSGGTVTILRATGDTSTEAASNCLTTLEAYLDSPQAEVDRLRYTDSYATQIVNFAKAKSYESPRHPGALYPKARISYG